jgi:hypothetical protein
MQLVRISHLSDMRCRTGDVRYWERKADFAITNVDFRLDPTFPWSQLRSWNLGDGYQARCPKEPVLRRCNDPGSRFMRGSFPALARY